MILLAAFVGAVAVHEVGHWSAARILGYPARIVVRWLGPGTMWGSDDVISPDRHRLAVAAAGPGANILVAAAAFAAGFPMVALVSLAVGLPQLVPVGPSDGTNILRAVRP